MLTVNNLTFRYPKQPWPTIADLTVDFAPGHVYGLFGSNGIGKSTLLYLMSGLLTPAAGNATLNGVDVRRRLPDTLNTIFLVPEEIELPELTLNQFVAANSPFYPYFSMEDFHRHMATFELPVDMGGKITRLSMGQRKKLYMSFALACNTPVVMMDEPTNGLDIPGKAAFRRFIASGATEERTIIISTHQAHDIESIVDHVVVMHTMGRLLLNASIDEIGRRLAFVVTNDPDLLSKALYAVPAVGGQAAVLPNDGSYDTGVNLESLFVAAVSNPDVIRAMFRGIRN